MRDFLEIDLGEGVRAYAYADDWAIIIEGDTRVEIEDMAGEALGRIGRWDRDNKVEYSRGKTEGLMLKGKFNRNRRPRVFFEGNRVAIKDEVTWLGITVQEGFKCGAQIARAERKALQAFMKIKRVSGREHGYQFQELKHLYKPIFEGIFYYGVEVWGRDAVTQRTTRAVRVAASSQRAALLAVTGAYATVSEDALPVIAGVLPIREGIGLRTDKFMVRTGRSNETQLEIRDRWKARWQDEWDRATRGRDTYGIVREVTGLAKIKHFRTNHWVTQVLTGHGNFKQKLFTLGLSEGENCLDCGMRDDREHFWNCGVNRGNAEKFNRVCNLEGVQQGDILGIRKNKRVFGVFAEQVEEMLKAREGMWKLFYGE